MIHGPTEIREGDTEEGCKKMVQGQKSRDAGWAVGFSMSHPSTDNRAPTRPRDPLTVGGARFGRGAQNGRVP